MKKIILDGKRVPLDPTKIIGSGGEADVYDIGNGKVLKYFKTPDHNDFAGMPDAQLAAKVRINEHQQKLPAFPKKLPPQVIVPRDFAFSQSGKKILGYSMDFLSGAEALLKYGERSFREGVIPDNQVVSIFQNLHETVNGIHNKQVVIGDFNDLNVLVRKEKAFIVDADSMQFSGFLSSVFTEKFLDPLHTKANQFVLAKPHNELSDWYAYAVMLMQALLFVEPYGGVFKPKNSADRIPKSLRRAKRVTVFHPDVRYPKPARAMATLPDELLSYFQEVFVSDKREVFPHQLLQRIRFGADGNLKATLEPSYPEEVIKETHTRSVSATRIFSISGKILTATIQDGELRYLYHKDGTFFRENDVYVTKGELDPSFRYRVSGKTSVLAKGPRAILLSKQGEKLLSTDAIQNFSLLDANSDEVFYISNGQLRKTVKRLTDYSEHIGNVLSNQTLFWVGEKLGFGFYRAGQMSRYFVFQPGKRGINDSVKLPPVRGQIIDSTTVFSDERIWFFLAITEGGKALHKCFVLDAVGTLLASFGSEPGSGDWLGTIRGHVAVSDFLLSPTDDGIVRVRASKSSSGVDKEFPETARFVHSGHQLLAGKSGLIVVKSDSIWNLVLK